MSNDHYTCSQSLPLESLLGALFWTEGWVSGWQMLSLWGKACWSTEFNQCQSPNTYWLLYIWYKESNTVIYTYGCRGIIYRAKKKVKKDATSLRADWDSYLFLIFVTLRATLLIHTLQRRGARLKRHQREKWWDCLVTSCCTMLVRLPF